MLIWEQTNNIEFWVKHLPEKIKIEEFHVKNDKLFIIKIFLFEGRQFWKNIGSRFRSQYGLHLVRIATNNDLKSMAEQERV